jgi:hypothetical protein
MTKLYYPGLAGKCREALEAIWQDVSEAAREHGYSLTYHGSVARDIDLVAVPWSPYQVSDAATVAEAIRLAAEKSSPCKFAFESATDKNPTEKPHGRLCWAFHLGAGPYIDLSVMPKFIPPPTIEEPTIVEPKL